MVRAKLLKPGFAPCLTTEIRGGECEIPFPKSVWLRQESVVNVQGIAGVDNAKIGRRIAAFAAEKLMEIESGLKRVLGLEAGNPRAVPLPSVFGRVRVTCADRPRGESAPAWPGNPFRSR